MSRSQSFNSFKDKLLSAFFLSETIEVALLMTNTTVVTENDGIDDDGDFTTLDEHDGASYARVTLTGKTVTTEDASDRAVLGASSAVFTGIGAGTRQIRGVLLLWNDAGVKRPVSYHHYETAKQVDGSGNFTVTWPTTSIMYAY